MVFAEPSVHPLQKGEILSPQLDRGTKLGGSEQHRATGDSSGGRGFWEPQEEST